MTPQEFDKLVESLGGTTKAGIALGISAGVVSQYRTGKRTIGNKMRARIDALTSPKQEPL